MKTTLKLTVTTALAMALVCPLHMALAQDVGGHLQVESTRILSGLRTPAIRTVAPVRRAPVSRSTTRRAQSRVNNRRPDSRIPIIDPRLVENLERIGRSYNPLQDPGAVRRITELARERNARPAVDALEAAPGIEQDLQPGEQNLVPPAAGAPANPACPRGCVGHCNHHGSSFGLDFPRWGFAYGPNGIYIRGGGRRYIDRPRNGVLVDRPDTVVAKPGVEIQEVNNLPRVYVATTIALSSKMPLGNDAGQVILDIQGISLPSELRAWTSESVTCTLPMMGLDQPKEARLIMVTAKGEVAHSIAVLLMPAKAPEVAPME